MYVLWFMNDQRAICGVGLSFHHVSPGNETQAFRLGCKYLLPMSYLAGPERTSHYINFSLTMF